ncbi:MAG: SprT family zinc-dependent metalloprotease [Chloroflexota bacterium]|nr:SprT family zinc-dependent metalloprotease [Chloroflexota bacterium]
MSPKGRAPLAVLGAGEISLDGRAIRYTLKRSARARYVRFEVRSETGLTVVVPLRYPLDKLSEMLRAKRHWILAKLTQFERTPPPRPDKFTDGSSIPYLGRSLRVTVTGDIGGAGGVTRDGDGLVVTAGPGNGCVSALLEHWYRAQAARVIRARVEELGAVLGVSYNRLTIRGQRTRWGSCSRKGNLNFNWKLLMAPQPVVDYVVVHELAHLAVMDHSKRFWSLVAQHCPDWRAHRRWLKEHGAELAANLAQ